MHGQLLPLGLDAVELEGFLFSLFLLSDSYYDDDNTLFS